jgi:hypothetical protein
VGFTKYASLVGYSQIHHGKDQATNTNLTNYGPNAYFWIFFETIRISAVSTVCRYPKNYF